MRTISVSEVLASIDESRAKEAGGVVAFDGDGTLWSGDIGDDFFDAILERGVHPVAHEGFIREASAANIDTSGTSRELGHRIYKAYQDGGFPEDRVCELIAWASAGSRKSDLDGFCHELVAKLALRGRLHGEALRVVDHARRSGVEVYVVSASPRAIVEAAAKLLAIEPTHVVAVRERYDGELVACDVVRPIPYRDGKVTQLRERLGATRPLYAAFGDNAFDVDMLRAAELPVAIRPKARLVERAAEVPGLAVLETLAT